MKLVPATEYTMEELTDAYNQTRQDYIVPMPMTTKRLQGYVDAYDIDLTASATAIDDDEPDLIFGLGMLGVRDDRSWITRLGVLPYARRLGTGGMLMKHLVEQTYERHLSELWLEVIAGNKPAHALFRKMGFEQTRELIVSRRPPFSGLPDESTCMPIENTRSVEYEEMIRLLDNRKDKPNWLNETETFRNVSGLYCHLFDLEEGAQGWLIYQQTPLQFKRVTVEVLEGDEAAVSRSILYWLHHQYPHLDAVSENIPTYDGRWEGYEAVGYFDSFHRIEMVKDMR